MMSDRPGHDPARMDVGMARRIDEVCLRFEADWREGRHCQIDGYLAGVSREGQAPLRTELEALAQELRQADTVVRPEVGSRTASSSQTAPHCSTITAAPTIAPRPPPPRLRPETPSVVYEASATSPFAALLAPISPQQQFSGRINRRHSPHPQ